jgi:hypothetical protein
MALPGTSGCVNNVWFEEAIDFAQCRNESRALSLMSLFRVNFWNQTNRKTARRRSLYSQSDRRSRAGVDLRRSIRQLCCSGVLARTACLVTALQIASASAMSLFCRLT